MLDITEHDDLIPLVGTPAFFPAIISHVRSTTLGSPPLDPAIFQAIFLCVIAGDKHLILHTPEEDVGLVARLAVWTLSSIFDFSTNKLKVKPRPEPLSRFANAPPADQAHFLHSLFLQTDYDFHDEDHSNSKKLKWTGRGDEATPPTSRSRPLKPRLSQYRRSASFPNNLAFGTTATPSLALSDAYVDQPHTPHDIGNLPKSNTYSSTTPPHPLHHAHTEPTPAHIAHTRLVFPHALVISGLENASTSEQVSLARILADKQVVFEDLDNPEGMSQRAAQGKCNTKRGSEGSRRTTGLDEINDPDDLDYNRAWNVPDGFITVYVCPWNPRERPRIHRSLLDQFAMSTTIFVHQSTRQALRALPFSSPYTTSHKYLRLHPYSYSNPSSPSPPQAPPLPQSQTPPHVVHSLPDHHHQPHGHHHSRSSQSTVPNFILSPEFIVSLRATCHRTWIAPPLSLYMSDLFSAVRHHPQLDGTFLTARSMKDAEDLACASRVLGIDFTGGELVRDTQGSKHTFENGNDDDQSFHEYDNITDDIGSGSITIDGPRDALFPESAENGPIADGQGHVEPLHVSEADIARIVPRVVTHRVSIRDGPEDEILGSAVFGATFDDILHRRKNADDYDWDTRSTVKDILVGILSEV